MTDTSRNAIAFAIKPAPIYPAPPRLDGIGLIERVSREQAEAVFAVRAKINDMTKERT